MKGKSQACANQHGGQEEKAIKDSATACPQGSRSAGPRLECHGVSQPVSALEWMCPVPPMEYKEESGRRYEGSGAC